MQFFELNFSHRDNQKGITCDKISHHGSKKRVGVRKNVCMKKKVMYLKYNFETFLDDFSVKCHFEQKRTVLIFYNLKKVVT